MSRSYKKPYNSTTTIGSRAGMQKDWKKECHRKIRRTPVDEEIPNYGKYKALSGDKWMAPNDGKSFQPDYQRSYRK